MAFAPNAMRVALAGLLAAVAAGCSDGAVTEDLRTWVATVESKPGGAIEPLPEFLPYQSYAYGAAGMRSPFEPPVPVRPSGPGAPRSDVKPDTDRPKQYLEQFGIGELRMVGTLQNDAVLFALIEDREGVVHRVSIGDYMGSNYGRILAIEEGEIRLMEIVPDGAGGWIERARTVNLAETGGA